MHEKLRIPIAPASGLGPRPPVRAASRASIGRGQRRQPNLSLSAGDDVVDDPVGFGLLGGRSGYIRSRDNFRERCSCREQSSDLL